MPEESRFSGLESMRGAYDPLVAGLVHSIQGASVTETPFPHLVIDNIFPDLLFEALIKTLPRPESIPAASDKGWASVAQYHGHRTSLFDELDVPNLSLWQKLEEALLNQEVEQATIGKFRPWIPPSALGRPLRREVRLDCTTEGAFLKPHTDHPAAFVKQLVYLTPSTYNSSLDTLLYAPRDPARRLDEFGPTGDFQGDEYHHESLESHAEAGRVQHRPNRMFVFLRSVNSLHGFGPLRCSEPRFLIAAHRQFARI